MPAREHFIYFTYNLNCVRAESYSQEIHAAFHKSLLRRLRNTELILRQIIRNNHDYSRREDQQGSCNGLF